jgi:DNA polymerase elongation subunit (family B)
LHDKAKDIVHVVERVDGKRVYQEYPASYIFYYDDPRGKFRSIYDTPVSRITSRSHKEFQKEVRMHSGKRTWESDMKPVFRCLADNYMGVDSPKLHTVFWDIETDFDPVLGYSKPEDPFNKITAISLYMDWLGKLVTLVLAPTSMSQDTAAEIAAKFSDCYLFTTELDMLDTFLTLIEDADVLSGWNSEGYDIPYTVNRVLRVMSKDDTRRFCLLGQYPKVKEFEKFGKKSSSYELIGRVHLDYMELYRKYTYEERHSYSLDAIGEYELDERKVDYDGTLDQLYNQDFETFIEYSRQDVMLLFKLDTKLRFIDLANELAHENTVLLPTVMGAVAVTDQAIINEAHARGMVVPDKSFKRKTLLDDDEEQDRSAAGAYVAHPKKGMHEYVGAIDINSLYPSAIRALNMGPETIVGQLRPIMTEQYIATRMLDKVVNGKKYKGMKKTAAWEGLFGSVEYNAVMNMEAGTEITIDWEGSGETTTHSAADVWRLIFDSGQPWCVSANGTIFRYDIKGIIPGLLARWYAERKELQKKKKEAASAGDKQQELFWDKRQLVKKINLNSLYGAILNQGCRFYDSRIGQSTTLTGRTISKHMHSHVNECITGDYNHEGAAIVYGDTDSVAFDSIIATASGPMTVESLFNAGTRFWQDGDKEYSVNHDIQVAVYTGGTLAKCQYGTYNYVYRHRTNKRKFQVTDSLGNTVATTEDHSVMVLEDGRLTEKKPTDLAVGDQLVSIHNTAYCMSHVTNILEQGTFDNEYVYDIGVSNSNPYFFANNIMVHNSSYFSAYSTFKKDIEEGKMHWDRDLCVELYDTISDSVNDSFPGFMEQAFHCPREMGALIKGGRESVASKGLFITKKRYAVLVYDMEGDRLDNLDEATAKKKGVVHGVGKVKATGLDLKRSDTPKPVQDFLSEILLSTLTGVDKKEIIQQIITYKTSFADKKPWDKGTPKRVNNLTKFTDMESKQGRANMPGHVRAAMNWNNLKRMNNDNYSMNIVDGMKTIVCRLKPNPLGYESIGVPTDQSQLPEWFTSLPFDDDLMEATIVDQKINNLLGVLNWELSSLTDTKSTFQSLFTVE